MEQPEEKISDEGVWWLPDNEQSQLHGRIVYGSSSGLELELIGSLFPIEGVPQFEKAFSVWGRTVRNKEISLVKAHLSSIRTHLPGMPTTKISAYEGVVGGLYRSLEEVAVHTVNVELDYLAAWAEESGIAQEYDPSTRKASISVQAPAPINLGEVNGIEVTITPFVFQSHSREGITLRNQAQLTLRARDARPYPDFEKLIRSFQKFLTLAVGEPAVPTRIMGETSEKAHEIEGKPVWTEIEIIRKRRRTPVKDMFADEMLFTLKDLGEKSGVTLTSLLKAEEKLAPVIDLLLLDYFHPQLPVPQEFLNFLNAVEVLHHVTLGGQYLSDEEYHSRVAKRLKQALPTDLSDEFRQSLETRLNNLHRYTLRKRLRDVLHAFEPILKSYTGGSSDFVDMVTGLRNSLLHSGNEERPNYAQLWRATQVLGLILEVALLREFGFSVDAVRRIVGRGKRARMTSAKNVT